MCTIAETPRLPQHCIQYAFAVEWGKNFDKAVDKDSVEDVEWIYKTALSRADKYGIVGVTYELTLGVIKNVIPAIASTNAIIAASTVLEAVKVLSLSSRIMKNSMTFFGHEGIMSEETLLEKSESCSACKQIWFSKVNGSTLLRDYLENLKKDKGLVNPSIYNKNTGACLYSETEKSSEANLEKKIVDLIEEGIIRKGSKLTVDDKSQDVTRKIQLSVF